MNLLSEDVFFRRVLRVSVAYLALSRVLLAMLMISKRGLDLGNLLFTICWACLRMLSCCYWYARSVSPQSLLAR
jgi:hypothetical protein